MPRNLSNAGPYEAASVPDVDAARQTAFEAIDRMADTMASRFTSGISPVSLTLAWLDWAMHLQTSPGKQMEMVQKAMRKASRLGTYTLSAMSDEAAECCIEPLAGDNRFRSEAWPGGSAWKARHAA